MVSLEKRKECYKIYNKALRDGQLVRSDFCDMCKMVAKDGKSMHGHHNDYNKPLEVDWLCVACHNKLSAKTRLSGGLS